MAERNRFTVGHGRGWSEPLAVGRWARFCQRLREPMTTSDLYSVVIFFAAAVPWIYLLARWLRK